MDLKSSTKLNMLCVFIRFGNNFLTVYCMFIIIIVMTFLNTSFPGVVKLISCRASGPRLCSGGNEFTSVFVPVFKI